ncbi:hypothetical protein [Gemmobacter aquatilis]|uniref:hypothetical protein n=1 Tax=Gemmobacter aquatilis TaxID=933059 RepID=UPI001587DF33|nr:hypothetical protein [Gemmobacter aquatilis]
MQRLMWASVVLEADPLADGACGLLDAVEALAMAALVLERLEHAFDHTVIRHDAFGAPAFGSVIVKASGVWGIGST